MNYFAKSEVINIPTIKGPITFKAGKELPDKFKESLKKEKKEHLPFKLGKKKKKKTTKKATKKAKK